MSYRTIDDQTASSLDKIDQCRFQFAPGLGDNRNEDGGIQNRIPALHECRKRGCGNHGIHRETLIESLPNKPIAIKNLGKTLRMFERPVVVFIERINPNNRTGLIRSSSASLQQMRDNLLGHLVGHISVSVIYGEQVQVAGQYDSAGRINPRHRHR